MEISIEWTSQTELTYKLNSFTARIRAELESTMTEISQDLLELVQSKLSGDVLDVKTGALKAAVQARMASTAGAVSAIVELPNPPAYAWIQEYGGTINHPGGTAINPLSGLFMSNATAMMFEARGITPRRTAPHPITVPERSYLRSSLADMILEIDAKVNNAIARAIE